MSYEEQIRELYIDEGACVDESVVNEILSELDTNNDFKRQANNFTIDDYEEGILFKYLSKENTENLLWSLDNSYIELINCDYIPIEILKSLIESYNEHSLNKNIMSLNYSHVNDMINNLLSNLSEENAKKFLSNINLKINEQFLPSLNEENIKKISNLMDEKVVKNFIKSTSNTEIIKLILLNTEDKIIKSIPSNYISDDILKKLIEELPEDDELFKKIMLLNYSDKVKDIFNKKVMVKELDEEESYKEELNENKELSLDNSNKDNKILKKFILNLDKETIKNLSYNDIEFIFNNIGYEKSLNEDFKEFTYEIMKNIIKNMSSKSYDEGYLYHFRKIFELVTTKEFVEKIIDNLDVNEIKKINLSKFFRDGKKIVEVINEILSNKNIKNKQLPKFNTDIIEKDLLFSFIRDGKINFEDLLIDSNSVLYFLGNKDKFNFIKNILVENILFLDDLGEKYNNQVLEKLAVTLSYTEMFEFIKSYCNCQKPQIQYNENKLRETLKNIKIENDILDRVYNEYNEDNDYLIIPDFPNKEIYKRNRENNLYLLTEKLKEKLLKRSNTIKNIKSKESENEIIEIENKLVKINGFFEKTYNKRNNEEIKEIINFLTKEYCSEVLRRAIVNYHRRIEPFVKKYFENNAEKLTKNIENALGILFDPNLPSDRKLEAQDILKENLGTIGKKYKEIAKKEHGENVSGNYLMFSSICNAENIIELNDAIYSSIRNKITNDYTTKQKVNNKGVTEQITVDKYKKKVDKGEEEFVTLFRGYRNILSDSLINTTEQIGRKKYGIWDMSFEEKLNINCDEFSDEPSKSLIGSFTSLTSEPRVALSYGSGCVASFCFPKNFYKSCYYVGGNCEEFAAYDIPLEYRIFNIVFNETGSVEPVKKVQFNNKMDFVIFRLNKAIKFNNKTIKEGESITKDELSEIIKSFKNKKEINSFLSENLTIERVFDRNKQLHEKDEITKNLENNEEKYIKTLEIENRLYIIKNNVKNVNDIIKNENKSLRKLNGIFYDILEKELVKTENEKSNGLWGK